MSVENDVDTKLRNLAKQVEESFVDSVRGLPSDDLKTKVVEFNQQINQQRGLQKSDNNIKELKEKLKDLNDGYKGVINEKLKRLNYLLLLLESRGKL
jgi:hypothetical protein